MTVGWYRLRKSRRAHLFVPLSDGARLMSRCGQLIIRKPDRDLPLTLPDGWDACGRCVAKERRAHERRPRLLPSLSLLSTPDPNPIYDEPDYAFADDPDDDFIDNCDHPSTVTTAGGDIYCADCGEMIGAE